MTKPWLTLKSYRDEIVNFRFVRGNRHRRRSSDDRGRSSKQPAGPVGGTAPRRVFGFRPQEWFPLVSVLRTRLRASHPWSPRSAHAPFHHQKNNPNEDRRRDVEGAPGATRNARRNVRAPQWSLRRPQAPFARGSRVTVSPAPGLVINGPPCSGAASVKATSGISLALPANGNSFRSGKNG